MNSQYHREMQLQAPYPSYNQPGLNKSYPPTYGISGAQNDSSNMHSQQPQNQHVQSSTPSGQPMHQISQDLNAVHLSQNQSHGLITQQFAKPPNIQGQQMWQQQQQQQPKTGGNFQNPPNSFPSNYNNPPSAFATCPPQNKNMPPAQNKPVGPLPPGRPYSNANQQQNAYNSNVVPQNHMPGALPQSQNSMPLQNNPGAPMGNMAYQNNAMPVSNNTSNQGNAAPPVSNMNYQNSTGPPMSNMTYQSNSMPPMTHQKAPPPMNVPSSNAYSSSAMPPPSSNVYTSGMQPPPQNSVQSHQPPVNGPPPPNSTYPSSQQGDLQDQRRMSNADMYGGQQNRPPYSAAGDSSNHYGNSSNMHARYPPTSASPGGQQGSPPSPGYGEYNNSYGSQQSRPMSSYGQPPSTRRLDPDNMPSPIQVIEDDRKLRSSTFSTGQRGVVPPLVTTNFTVADEGMCSPRFIRSTVYSVPTTNEVLKQTNVPFALAISPFARVKDEEQAPPIVDPGEDGPVRCHRCRAYMSPFMQFIDAGRRFQCLLCNTTSEVPAHYFTHLDHMGERVDKHERAELCLGSYEFIVNKDYCKEGKFPNCPAFIFLIDVSYNSIRSGVVKILCDNMKSVLECLPREEGAEKSDLRVGFVTYGTVVHFYNVNSTLAQPQMLVVSDVSDMFMPLLDGFLVHHSQATAVIDSLMEQIPVMFAETKETETVLGPAIQAGLEALKAAECAGKLLIFHSCLPIAEAPGKLKNRDDRKLLGSDKEKTILNPQTTFYNNLGQECVKAGCSVDLFLFNNAYIDVATLGQVCRLTGGSMFKYTYFQGDLDGERFLEDLRRNVEKPIAFDAVLRVRTSTGIRPIDFIGCFFMSNTTDVELASVNCDSSITVEIKYDDKLDGSDGVYIQCAVLYTGCSGQRRLRVHNLALNTCTQMADLFRNCELDTMLNVFLKDGVRRISEESPKHVKETLVNRSAGVLACYRKHCAQASSAGQLILPECMKLLPLYINCLISCDALAGGQEMNTDDRSFIMLAVLNMDVDSTAAYLYPRMLPLHDSKPQLDENECIELPTALRCSMERIKDHGVYLIENGLRMFLYIGANANPDWVQDVFGVTSVARIDVERNLLMPLNTPASKWVHAIIDYIQSERERHMKIILVRAGDKSELLLRQLLVEDRTTEGSASYVDFLCHLHKEIRSLLS